MKLWERARVRSAIYEYLSAAFLYPGADTLTLLKTNGETLGHLFSALYSGEGAEQVLGFARQLSGWSLDEMQEEFTTVFGHIVSTDCPPYEGEYGQAHIFNKSQSLADLGGFFKAFGLEPDPGLRDRMDHISVELEFMHFLAMKEAHALVQRHGKSKVELCRKAQRAFLEEHLGYWACSFSGRLARLAEGGPYAYLAHTLDCFVREEMSAYGLTPGPERPIVPEPRVDEDPACYQCPLAVGADMEVNIT